MSTAVVEKQGIVVAILGSADGERARASSLRRTLSADMSSKKWMAQNGLIKKIASSKELNSLSSSDEEDEEEEEEEEEESRLEVWNSIQQHQLKIKDFDIWSSVTSQAAEKEKALPPPYVHPLVKRSASSLSQKSLQICTESLGSETGSDGFSEKGDEELEGLEVVTEKPQVQEQEQEQEQEEEYRAVKFNSFSGRKSAEEAIGSLRRPFPPSLSSRSGGGGTLRIRTHRDNGRLVVEAVSIPPSQRNFAAERREGRLVLNFANNEIQESESESEEEEDVEQEQEEVRKIDTNTNTESRLISFHRLALMANKPTSGSLPNRRNPTKYIEEDHQTKPSLAAAAAKCLPPRPRGPVGRLIPAATVSFNHYDYFWRNKTNVSNDSKDVSFKNQEQENDRKEFVVSRGNCLVPLLTKGCCKEPRRSLIWEPRCIAT